MEIKIIGIADMFNELFASFVLSLGVTAALVTQP